LSFQSEQSTFHSEPPRVYDEIRPREGHPGVESQNCLAKIRGVKRPERAALNDLGLFVKKLDSDPKVKLPLGLDRTQLDWLGFAQHGSRKSKMLNAFCCETRLRIPERN